MLAINQRLLRQVFKRGLWCRCPINGAGGPAFRALCEGRGFVPSHAGAVSGALASNHFTTSSQ